MNLKDNEDNENNSKVSNKFYCKTCDYIATHKGNLNQHYKTKKHKDKKRLQKGKKKLTPKEAGQFKCNYCIKSYKFRSGLSRHQKNCSNKKILDKKDLSKDDLIQIVKMIVPNVSQNNIINNNKTYNNNITNQINIQLFLDENCKDAMTIQNFAMQLTLTIEDLIKKRTLGLCGGVDNIVIKNLEPIPLLERPIHCTNIKKRQWIVNDEESGWKKDNGGLLLKQAGFGINKKFNQIWDKAYPGWNNNEDLKQKWMQLVKDLSTDYSEKDIEKALKKIGPECKLTVQDIKSIL